ncbi:uncharacterized protein LOC132270076 [Cornus florida]|uniref:uncharacterized protein LOC132270076 n=1 Tax=Cornus florida TaxID=4283 RepID=UPI00289B6C99|nr:uncharacterized protein LOC132270076 [Cornus florida]
MGFGIFEEEIIRLGVWGNLEALIQILQFYFGISGNTRAYTYEYNFVSLGGWRAPIIVDNFFPLCDCILNSQGNDATASRFGSKAERIVADSMGELSFHLRPIRRVRDPLRPLLPHRVSHLQRSDIKTGIQSDPCKEAWWT